MTSVVVDDIELVVDSYRIDGTGILDAVTVEVVASPDHGNKWAIRQLGHCLTKAGDWIYEPMPSSRTNAFRKRTRFDTLEQVVAAWKKAGNKGRV